MRSPAWTGLFILIWCAQAAAQEPAQDALRLTDAVRAALSRHPSLEIQRQEVEIGAAVQRQASGAFDQVLETRVDHGRLYSPSSQLTGFDLAPSDASNLTASYSRLLRSGVAVAGSVDLRRQIDSGVIRDGLTTSSTRLSLIFPLMQGRGTRVTTSGERSAGLRRDSSLLEVRHVTASLMARVVSSYWGLVAAERSRQVAAASSERGALLVDNTQALIAADQAPRSDLASARANGADREAARFVAEQAYVAARQRLLLDMGYGVEDSPEIALLDDFSLFGALPDVGALSADAEQFVAGALERRTDYLAAETRVEATRIVREASNNGLLPEVDFSLNVGYTALAEGRALGNSLAAFGSGLEGPEVFGQITYRLPVRNRVAAGRLAQADAELRQATLTRDDLARTIRSSVIESYSALRYALAGLERARESVEAFEEALLGEQDKLALGIGSIVSLLTIEDRLTAAAEREVAAWRSYAQALIDFRFATGALVPAQGQLPPLDAGTFTTFPFTADAGRP